MVRRIDFNDPEPYGLQNMVQQIIPSNDFVHRIASLHSCSSNGTPLKKQLLECQQVMADILTHLRPAAPLIFSLLSHSRRCPNYHILSFSSSEYVLAQPVRILHHELYTHPYSCSLFLFDLWLD